MANFTGTSGADNFTGTAGAADNFYFNIANLGQNDFINGGGTLLTDPLDSLYLSGTGVVDFAFLVNDIVNFNPYTVFNHVMGIENLYLSPSNSTVHISQQFANGASNGLFQIFGQGTANDTIIWENYHVDSPISKVIVRAGDGNDTVNGWGSLSSLEVYGEGGDDHLSGAYIMDGGSGNDTIDVGSFGIASKAYGGIGNDLINIMADNVIADGGDGTDFVSFDHFYSSITYINIEGLKVSALSCTLAQLSQFTRIAALDPALGATFNVTGGGTYNFATLAEAPAILKFNVVDTTTTNYTIVATNAQLTFVGGGGDDYVIGGTSADAVYGGDGNNTLYGEGGDDTLYGGGGNTTYYGGTGNDYIGLGRTGPISPANEIAYGEEGDDSFHLFVRGGTTAPVSHGTIDGGTGWDVVYCDDGLGDFQFNNVETLVIGQGQLYATVAQLMSFTYFAMGPTNFYISGNGTVDLNGKTSNPLQTFNMFAVDTSNHVFIGSAGNDYLTGGYGNDRLEGGDGNDIIYGAVISPLDPNTNGGQDVLNGGAGNDEIHTVGIDDVVSGGAGNDTIYAIGGVINGGDGLDTLVAAQNPYTSFAPVLDASSVINVETLLIDAYSLTTGLSQLNGFQTIQTNQPAFSPQIYLNLTGDGSINFSSKIVDHGVHVVVSQQTTGVQIIGTNFDDNIQGSQFADVLSGGLGNDYISGGSGSDTINGGDGIDILLGEDGNDILNGGLGDDNLSGGSGTDAITAGAGDDLIDGGTGADKMAGGTGNDTYVIDNAGDTVDETGGDGIDAFQSSVSVNLADTTHFKGNIEIIELTGFASIDATGNDLNNLIIGTTGNNTLNGGLGNDYIVTNGGSDTIYGGAGNDTVDYLGTQSSITIDLGATSTYGYSWDGTSGTILIGIENIIGNDYDNILIGNSENNVIEGGYGSDVINGKAGNDTVTYDYSLQALIIDLGATATYGYSWDGFSGDTLISIENIVGTALNDILIGDGLDNRLEGGAGSDTINGKGGIDTVTYEHSSTAVILNLSATATYGYSVDGTSGDILMGIENVVGSSFADTLLGDGQANLIEGGAGSDYINGLGGIDTVTYVNSVTAVSLDLGATATYGYSFDGTFGDTLLGIENVVGSSFGDTLLGNGQANTLDGGLGNDILKGGLGADTFRFTSLAFGNDTITDYQDIIDHLSFGPAAALNFANFTITGNDTTAVTIHLTGGGDVLLVSATATNIHIDASDFLFG
jgi:Ca2+-binding RTX toxin-like protein